jgi:hypothetical protein
MPRGAVPFQLFYLGYGGYIDGAVDQQIALEYVYCLRAITESYCWVGDIIAWCIDTTTLFLEAMRCTYRYNICRR